MPDVTQIQTEHQVQSLKRQVNMLKKEMEALTEENTRNEIEIRFMRREQEERFNVMEAYMRGESLKTVREQREEEKKKSKKKKKKKEKEKEDPKENPKDKSKDKPKEPNKKESKKIAPAILPPLPLSSLANTKSAISNTTTEKEQACTGSGETAQKEEAKYDEAQTDSTFPKNSGKGEGEGKEAEPKGKEVVEESIVNTGDTDTAGEKTLKAEEGEHGGERQENKDKKDGSDEKVPLKADTKKKDGKKEGDVEDGKCMTHDEVLYDSDDEEEKAARKKKNKQQMFILAVALVLVLVLALVVFFVAKE